MVSQIHVTLDGKCEFPMSEQSSGRMLLVKPCKDRLERVEHPVKLKHNFWGSTCVVRHGVVER